MDVLEAMKKEMFRRKLRKSMRLNMKYSKTPKTVPTCLTREEVKKLITSINNVKHKLLISLMYGAGLRVSEAVALKPCDIDFEANVGWVRHGKGNKDRPFILPACLLNELKGVVQIKQNFLFPGAKGAHLSPRTVGVVLKDAAKKAGIAKHVHPHTLRHSFATHLLEQGNDVVAVQSLLGHNDARTTLTYPHTGKARLLTIRSPLDFE